MTDQQAVFISLDGISLPDWIYEQNDLFTLEDELIAIVEKDGVGKLDGSERGPTATTLYLYGPNAVRIFKAIEPVLSTSPLCQNAKVLLRSGGPRAPSTEVVIPANEHPRIIGAQEGSF